ncbi:MAG: PIN domain-containing protein [Rhizomicrobium sp.]
MSAVSVSTSRMSATDFFDSNVLLYLVSLDATKADRVEVLVSDGGTVSTQVLNEFAAVATRKFGRPLNKVRDLLNQIRSACEVVPLDIATHDIGLDIAERYKYSIFDSMLLAAATRAKCTTLFTEDLHHGQIVGGLTIRNPFRP